MPNWEGWYIPRWVGLEDFFSPHKYRRFGFRRLLWLCQTSIADWFVARFDQLRVLIERFDCWISRWGDLTYVDPDIDAGIWILISQPDFRPLNKIVEAVKSHEETRR